MTARAASLRIWFARLSEQKLTRAMVKSGISQKKMQEIRNAVAARAGNLWAAAKYLRGTAGLKNVWWPLVPLGVNQSVREATPGVGGAVAGAFDAIEEDAMRCVSWAA